MKKTAGFTLIELLIVITLAAVLIGIALPSYQALIASSRTTTQINQLLAAINFARSEAILRHKVVTLCKSMNGKSCGGEWKNGWIVFVDHQISGQVEFGDEILRVYGPVPQGGKLEWQGQRSNNYLQMDSSGATRGQAGTFYYYPNDNVKAQVSKVIVSQTGRVRREFAPSQ